MANTKRSVRIGKRSIGARFVNRFEKSNFAHVEDSDKAIYKIQKIAGRAVKVAAATSKRHGLAAIKIKGNLVIKTQNKTEQVIATINKKATRQYKVGEILYAKKG